MKWRWIHVSKKAPCPKCGKDSWCSICPDLKLVLCMRETSDRPSKNAMGGWIHPIDGEVKVYQRKDAVPDSPSIDADSLMREYAISTKQSELISFSKSLGVSVESLRELGCERAEKYKAWAFPMSNGAGRFVGIRLRGDNGKKFAVLGSRQGIFLPRSTPSKTAFIVEGASDAAALLSMGLYGFGRPQCCGSIAIITATVARLRIKEVVIVADSDAPGIKGANELSAELDVPNQIFIPPTKDLRQLFNFGATADFVRTLLKDLIWNLPKKNRILTT